jgi:Na+/H+-dicarboxylate symporter
VHFFERIPDFVEDAGALLTQATPLFMCLIGIYTVSLPGAVTSYVARAAYALAPVALFGYRIDTSSSRGILVVYVTLSVLTGLICALWHAALLLAVRVRMPHFSIRRYVIGYWSEIYPLVWSTCSESLATPANLRAMRRNFGEVGPAFRQFATALGANVNINGTIICTFILVAAVCQMTGMTITASSLLLCAPVIFLIGFGVPGMPGELLLFAGPIAAVLRVGPHELNAFILLFVTLQLGFPDSFRSGANVTDSAPAILLIHRGLQRSGGLDDNDDLVET